MKGILAVFLVLILGMVPVNTDGTYQAASYFDDIIGETDPDWLLILYMAGDNNLGRDGYEWGNAVKMDLEEIEDTMPSSGVEILALADMEGANNTYLYDLEPGPSRGVNSPTIDLSEVNPQWDDELDMSDWRTLRDFLVFSMTNRSAKNVMFVLWNHGAGWYSSRSSSIGSRSEAPSKGFALDSNSGGAMYLNEFRDAFTQAENTLGSLHMDLIGFDTCSMGMMEVYYQIAPWFDMAIGSEDEQPWYGYNYTFTSVMGGSDPYTPLELGKHIIQEFKDQYMRTGEYTYATVTLVDLEMLKNNLTIALNDLSLNIFERMYQNEIVLNHKFSAVRGRTEMLGFENVDLGHLLKNLIEGSLQEEITNNASASLGIYNDTILGEWHQPDGRNIRATGISIYLPPSGSYRTTYDGYTGFLNFTGDSLWDEMIREYHDPNERVSVDISVDILDGDGILDDVTLTAMNGVTDHAIHNGMIFIDDHYSKVTDANGKAVFKNMQPGTYLFEVYNGTHVGENTIKILNRAPIANVTPMDPVVYEKHFFILDASGSWDLDGDRLTFKWDLDASDGLNGSDSISPMVNISFPEKGNYTIRMTVNDTELSSHIDVNVKVVNAPPTAVINAPSIINEDDPFIISAAGSWDTWPDAERLLYLFTMNGTPIMNWTNSSSISHFISEKGWYEIGVVVSDPDGDMASASKNLQVLNVAPIANITGPTKIDEDEFVEFSAEGSVDTISDVPTLSYQWYMDGVQELLSEEKMIGMMFGEQETHVIELHVIDDDGVEDITTFWFDVVNVPPNPSINVSAYSVYEDETVTLECPVDCDTVSDMPNLNFSWDMDGDGIYDNFGPVLEISWSDPGSYMVRLKVEDDDGNISFEQVDIFVSNLLPAPTIVGPQFGDEDEELSFSLAPGTDSPSDIPSLDYEWYIEGVLYERDTESITVTLVMKGTYNLTVNVTDDNGAYGKYDLMVTIRNPKPTIFMENVPANIEEGKEFTVYGYRSYDNPSDMVSLIFQWYLDDEPISGANGRNLTLTVEVLGPHTLMLIVTDDDGDKSTASIPFNVDVKRDDPSSLAKGVDRALSSVVFIILVGLLLLILLVIFQMNKKMKELPPPLKKELAEDDQEEESKQMKDDSADTDVPEEGSDLSEGEDDDEQEDLQDEDPDDIDDGPFNIEDEMDIEDPPGLYSPTEAPEPPKIDDADIPEVDGSIFGP